jgi:glutamyl-tRNA synthetase
VNNTPRQILIYQALGAPLPHFIHVPMILGEDRTRLSKRHGATSVMSYQEMGFLPEALVNYLVRLGWSHGDQEVFSREELVRYFSFANVGKSPSVFNPEKLLWLNAHYIKEKAPKDLVPLVKPFLSARNYPEKDAEFLAKAIHTLQPRAHTLQEMADGMKFYMINEVDYDPAAAKKFLTPAMREPFIRLMAAFEGVETFSQENLEKAFQRAIVEEMGLKLGKVAQPVRVALTGVTVSPGLFEIIDVLGKEVVFKRLRQALDFMEKG